MPASQNHIAGKVCLITGGTSGIGAATAFGLAERGATVVIIGRNGGRCAMVSQRIHNLTGAHVEFVVADLSSQHDVRQAARTLRTRFSTLDVLVNNAGSYYMRRQLSEDGLEMTFALDHLAYFLLTNLLLEQLMASPSARIVNVSSSAHERGTVEFGDLQGEQNYDRLKAYAQAKLANLLFTYELSRKLTGTTVTANALHPGSVATNLGSDNGRLRVMFRNIVRRGNYLKPAEGARTSIYLASSPEVQAVSGRYFVRCQAVKSSLASYDVDVARRLWRVSEEMTGIRGMSAS